FGRNSHSLQPSPLARPTLGKKQPQRQHDWYLASRKRQRYQGLAVRGLAQRRSILRSDTNRMHAFLGYRTILDHHHGTAPPDGPVSLDKEVGCTRAGGPDPGRNEVMHLTACADRKPLRHRLNALALARTNQSRHVERAHLSPCFVTQPIQKRLEPTSELVSPIRRPANHGRPLQKADHPSVTKNRIWESRDREKSAKVVLGSMSLAPRFCEGWKGSAKRFLQPIRTARIMEEHL